LKEGLKKLIKHEIIDSTEESLASFVFNNELVSKAKIGELLGVDKPFNNEFRKL